VKRIADIRSDKKNKTKGCFIINEKTDGFLLFREAVCLSEAVCRRRKCKQSYIRRGNFTTKILFHLFSWQHNLVAAATAFKPEIHAGAQNFPFICAAGMRLFHFYDSSKFKIHRDSFL
jgi:hypothetical protein